ncbi:Mdm20p ASCRUDRAFT_68275 [Ascoidea rubescens DSM 1968]|uniref:Uncharacterized protein n=1 Tax=Ascoidea rubescens DSM 1968 TaxID=1344418 RepID=A0A1D2VRT2_9ASCO|nr:hypothetical protein ASCRUDRAFT_68275 [Ascoidea rubescens DSM 1968]ODV64275.1 hypothetical protein ASCRUDRAFT_68275 [Ascoidea rubescens DSM 1968]
MSSNSKEQAVFQAVESGAFKNAHQLITKLLKKSPQNTYYMSINSYIIYLLGKKDEAIKMAIDIMNSNPNNIKTIKFLHNFFKNSNLIKESNQIFENAVKNFPNNFDLINEWNEINLQELNIRNLQKSSAYLQKINIQKTIKRDLILNSCFNYYLVSNLKDATPFEKNLFPKLGLKLIDSIKPLTTTQELFIQVSLLKQSNQNKEIVHVIDVFKSKSKLDLNLQIIYLNSLSILNENSKLFEFCTNLIINENFDDYDTWIYFYNSSIQLNKLDQFTDLVKKFETKNKNSRNIKLIQIYMLDNDLQNNNNNNFQPYENYLLKFAVKNCCFYDLRSFFNSKSFNQEKIFKFLNQDQYKLLKIEDLLKKNKKPTLNQITWLVNLQKFKAYFNKDKLLSQSNDNEFKEKFLSDNINYYNSSKVLLNEKLETDYFIADEFLFLNLQIYLNNNTNDDKTILSSIVILEYLLESDKHEFHLKLWLVVLYRQLNLFKSAIGIFKTSSIKSMQHDTLDYYIFNKLSSTFPRSNYFLIRDFFKDNSKFYSQENQFDYLNYYLEQSYAKKSFSQIEDMILFVNRLKNSSSRYLALFERFTFNKINKSSINDFKKDLIQLNKKYLEIENTEFFDNRDFTTIWEFGFSEELNNISENLEFFSKRNEKNSSDFIKLNLFKTVLIYNNEKSIGEVNECFKKYETLYEDKIEKLGLTEVEKIGFQVIYLLCKFIIQKDKIYLNQLEEIYSNERIFKMIKESFSKEKHELINWKDNHLLITSIELLNDVNKLLINYDSKISSKFRKNINKLKSCNNDCLKKVKEFKDNLILKQKPENENVLKTYQREIEESELIKELKIEKKFIAKIFDNIREDYHENFVLYKVI